MSTNKMFTVDKFLGINESADGNTEIKMGEASRMENWFVTDGFNLTLRPGIRRVGIGTVRDPQTIFATWAGFVGEVEYFIICDFDSEQDRLWVYSRAEDGAFVLEWHQDGALGLTQWEDPMVKIFSYAGHLYVMSKNRLVWYTDNGFEDAPIYVPLVIAGSDPEGGGTTLENINMLTEKRRITFTADGESADYQLPVEAVSIDMIIIDNEEQEISSVGSWNSKSRIFTFNDPPIKGIGNVEIVYSSDKSETNKTFLRLAGMKLVEAYNGSTETRIFFAGDGTNICFYSGVPESGDLSLLYFPAMNEVSVDMSDSPVTGMIRHYSKLLVFKPDGTYSITYEPVTLEDGNTIAGFYLRNVNKGFGHDVVSQIQTVNNYPRTISHGGIYEWRITSSYYKDERYAKRISDMVNRSLESCDITKVVDVDDNVNKTYYIFLNDDDGTVLVNRYGLTNDGIWCIYKSQLCKNVTSAFMMSDVMIFCNDKEAFFFDTSYNVDAPETIGGESTQIKAIWESGYMSFGADFRRKYSSNLYVSVLPDGMSRITVTASTDRREEYMEKMISTDLFNWSTVTFPTWTFNISSTPGIKRVRLKVKKFVYYKLILKVEEYGASANVLGYDQEVRFSSMAK